MIDVPYSYKVLCLGFNEVNFNEVDVVELAVDICRFWTSFNQTRCPDGDNVNLGLVF